MSAVYFTYFGAVGAMVPFLSVYLSQMGLSGTEIGILLSMQPVLMLLSQPIFGPLADRSGHRGKMLATLLLITGLTGLLLTASRQFLTLLLLVTVWSFFAGLIGPIADSIALGEMEATGVAYTRLRLWGSIGFLITTIGAGWLYGFTGLLWAFPAYGALMLAAVYFARRLPAEGITSAPPDWHDVLALVKNPFLMAFLLVASLEQMTLAANSAFFSIHMSSIGGSSSALGWAWGAAAFWEVPAWLLFGSVVSRTGPLPLLAFSAAAYGLRWHLYSVVTSPMWLVGLSVLQSFTYAMFMPTAVLLVGELTPPALRTSGQALLGMVTLGLATLLGTAAGGRLVDELGTAGMYRVGAWVSLAAGGGFLLLMAVRAAMKRREAGVVG